MKQSLQIHIGQQLVMSPQLQQSIRLLQLSSLELETEIREALESNIMLEIEEGDGDSSHGAREEDGVEAGGDGMGPDMRPSDIPWELPIDTAWEDIYDGGLQGFSNGGSPSLSQDPDAYTDIGNRRSGAEGLREYLYQQAELCHFSEIDRLIAIAIIDAIDDNGYLPLDMEEIRQSLWRNDRKIDLDEIETVLHRIQTFEPTGVGARNPRDCLLLQLRALPRETPWRQHALELTQNYLNLLERHDYNRLMQRMALDRDRLQQVISLIQSLNPRPGALIDATPIPYIIPDIFVKKINGRWRVDLNPETMPRIRLNPGYVGLVRRADNSADNSTLRSHLQEARWFLRSLQSRNDTLLKVASCIVERQKSFLEYGEEAMEPMVTQDVADAVGVHASTISRVTTRKYMHAPCGVYELKSLFSSHVAIQAGGKASSTAIRALIKKLIAAENAQHPISDAKLAGIFSERGINVARRTVAKYREMLGIPSSSDRKRFTG
uniref:RNA polymerase sigma-54 factor n=1 Tax=Candidatus Kentrum sp. SD TaxID=2126332 RepID=A0A451BL88_9GAMM|nr:MAG: RNA polymerase, sigma 54 subunit, RpoN/SigL [Candidatus Kentron sp. SD]VFK45654.1 MAG: RNA polymerase, sigma 54 subunit, RpoN/SigL [Candidatus Kentron sp. SD]VFK79060.1 MAG: RNA polymerase, sigma 54 subunit, RpoN/SigL [Candidatus Kentron sp. SD]